MTLVFGIPGMVAFTCAAIYLSEQCDQHPQITLIAESLIPVGIWIWEFVRVRKISRLGKSIPKLTPAIMLILLRVAFAVQFAQLKMLFSAEEYNCAPELAKISVTYAFGYGTILTIIGIFILVIFASVAGNRFKKRIFRRLTGMDSDEHSIEWTIIFVRLKKINPGAYIA